MRVFSYKLVSAGDMSGAIISPPQQVNQMVMACVQASWSGSTPTGTLKLYITNDDVSIVGAANAVWSEYQVAGTPVELSPAGNSNGYWLLDPTAFQYLRVTYTRNSGSGTLNVTVSGKGP